MDAIALIIAKFSREVFQTELACLSLFVGVAIWWFLIRRRERHGADWVPAAVVKEYLDRVAADERNLRYRLFGDQLPYNTPVGAQQPIMAAMAGVQPTIQTVMTTDPNMVRELEALRQQLGKADLRAAELDKMIAGLKDEKAKLEAQAKSAPAAGGAGADTSGLTKQISDLSAKLKEYEVIEDDLANLKKYQQENKELREKLGGAAGATVAAPAAAAPAPVAAAPTPAPAAVAAAPAAEAAAAPAGDPKKKEADLLNEFEKMLAS